MLIMWSHCGAMIRNPGVTKLDPTRNTLKEFRKKQLALEEVLKEEVDERKAKLARRRLRVTFCARCEANKVSLGG